MTSKPISTISYNSEKFLHEVLERWRKDHIIQTYMYICHTGEDGDKDHIHVRIEPNKKLDPMDLSDELQEFDPNHEKPLGCRPFRPSKEEDWFLYAYHDPDYLKIKYKGGEPGEKLFYDYHKIVVPDNYDLDVAIVRARSHMDHTTSKMAERMATGTTPLQLISEGENVFEVNAIHKALTQNDYDRMRHEYDYVYKDRAKIQEAVAKAGFVLKVTEDGYELEAAS